MSWDLGTRRDDWTAWIKGKLRDEGNTQNKVAEEIAALEGGHPKRTQVSRFVTGDPAEVETWFTMRGDWLAILARKMGRLQPDDLKRQFEQLRDGHSPVAEWHPAFPDLQLADAEIPAPLDSREGDTPETVVRAWVEDAQQRSAGKPQALFLIGPPGTARDVAARQLRAAVLALVPDADVRVVGEAPEKNDAVWRIVTATKPPPRGQHRAAHLASWRSREAVALALRLADAQQLSDDARLHLRRYAERVAAAGDDDAMTLSPDLHIRLCAEVAQRGCPDDIAGIRTLLTAAAWRRAEQGSERLRAFDEVLLERFFAKLASRVPSPGETGGWSTAPRAVAAAIIGEAARALGGDAAGKPLVALLDDVVEEKRPAGRLAALDKLRRAILADPADALLAELIAGGVLVEEPSSRGPRIRAADPVLAAIWAARGLGGRVTVGDCWVRLSDPELARLVGEQARGGLAFGTLADVLARAPAELEIDAALVALGHAAAAPRPVDDPRLVHAWATVLWAVALGYLQASPGPEPWGWSARATAALRIVSRRYRYSLPRLGDDPVATIEALAPERARALVERWRPAPTGEAESLLPRHEHGWSLFYDRGSRTTMGFDLCHLAPDQVVSDTPERARKWRGSLSRVVEEAERGDAGCAAMLSGEAWVTRERGEDHDAAWHFWNAVPWSVRLEWAIRAGPRGEEGYQILCVLLRGKADRGDPRFVDLGARIGVEPMEGVCRMILVERPLHEWFPVELALEVAERLRLVGLLEEVAARPIAWAVGVFPSLRDGFIRLDHEYIRPIGEDGRAPHLPLRERLAAMDEIAERAAVILYRLGRPVALRARWLEPGPAFSDHTEGIAARIDGLLWLASNPSSWWRLYDVPLDALGAFAELRPEGERARFALDQGVGLRNPKAWMIDVDPEGISPRLARALEGLAALLHELPDELPDDLDAALARVGHLGGRMVVSRTDRYDSRREAAALHLLRLGDDAPLESWARGDHLYENAAIVAHAAAHAVRDAVRQDDAVLERAWMAFTRTGGGNRDDEQRRWERNGLMYAASAPREGDDRPDHPLPFVVALGLSSDDPDEVESLTALNGRRPAWLPVARRRYRAAPDPRTRAFWALEIARHQPGAREVRDVLLHWLKDDPDPWSGGTAWHRDGWRFVGGTKALLDAVLALDDADAEDGLARLFRLALELPIRHERFDPYKAPERVLLAPSVDEPPWPILPLAEALVARGRVEVVLECWRAPPDGECTVSHWTHGQCVRSWLDRWWTQHATTAELKSSLIDGDTFRRRAAWELVRRGELDLRADIVRVCRDWLHPPWELLARVAPEDLVPALHARIAKGVPREIVVAQLAALGDEVWEAGVMGEVRRMVLKQEDE